MRHRLFTLVCLLSFLLCLATLLLWCRSLTRSETLAHWETGQAPANDGIDRQLISARSRLTYERSWTSATFIPQPPAVWPPPFWERLGFGSSLQQSSDIGETFTSGVPAPRSS